MDGLLVVNKPKGWTSFDVVAKIRNKLGVKKVGHTGTLDPMATGVLVLCLGKATKMAEQISAQDKEYVAEITFGATSNTDDAEGGLKETKNPKPLSQSEVETALRSFEGEIEQMPPQFSAKKVGGKRAYKLARQGKTVELTPSKITIHELELTGYQWPILKLRILCSKGTYIRAIARDLGQLLGCGAYLSALERTQVGNFKIAQAQAIEDISAESVKLVS